MSYSIFWFCFWVILTSWARISLFKKSGFVAHWKTITSIQRPKNICNWLELMCWGLRPQSLLFLLLSFVSVFYVLFIYAKGILCFICCFHPWKHTDLDFGSGLPFLSIGSQIRWKRVSGRTMTGFHTFLSSLKSSILRVCKSCWILWFSFKLNF